MVRQIEKLENTMKKSILVLSVFCSLFASAEIVDPCYEVETHQACITLAAPAVCTFAYPGQIEEIGHVESGGNECDARMKVMQRLCDADVVKFDTDEMSCGPDEIMSI